MLEKVDLNNYSLILEPSAGKGNIIKALINKGYKGSIDFIEPVKEFCNIVKNIKIGEEHVKSLYSHSYESKPKYPHYAGRNFLSFETFKLYSLIIMNPPFGNGDKYLLKAINIMQNGGRIVCLLNSETLNNPYSNIRKGLQHKLREYEAKITDLGQAFKYAERKTEVNVSIVDIIIPYKEEKTYIFE